MTVYLNRMLFKPALIVLSAIFGLFFLLFAILTIAAFNVVLLVITILVAVAYGVMVALVYRVSKLDKYYLREEEPGLLIRYPTMNFDRGAIRIPYKALIGFEFYPIHSKASWLHFMTTGIIPGCVYVTYINRYGHRVTELMGYITQSDVEALAQRYNMKFTLK